MSLQCFSDISIHRSHLSSTMSQCKHSFCLHSPRTREGYRGRRTILKARVIQWATSLDECRIEKVKVFPHTNLGLGQTSQCGVPPPRVTPSSPYTLTSRPGPQEWGAIHVLHPVPFVVAGWQALSSESTPVSLQHLWVHRCRPSDKVVTFGLQVPWGKMHEVCHMALLPPLPTQWGAWFFLSKNVSSMSRHRSRALLQIWSIFKKWPCSFLSPF